MSRHLSVLLAGLVLSLTVASCGNVENLPDLDVAVDVLAPDGVDDASDVESVDVVVPPDADDAVTVDSGDANANPDVVGGPHLTVDPETVDFGFGAINTPKMAQLVLTNDGTADLTIEKLEITNPSTTQYGEEFVIVEDVAFAPTLETAAVAAVIPAGDSVTIQLQFTNKGPDTGDLTATLVITTDAAGQESVVVPISAYRSSEPDCRLQIIPENINFGTTPIGFDVTHVMRLVNTGTGSCQVLSAKVVDCPADGDGLPVCQAPGEGSASEVFHFVTVPADIAKTILPGNSLTIQVRFSAPAVATGAGPAGQFWALASFTVNDPFTDVTELVPACESDCSPNLIGYGGTGQAKVLPADIDFGLVIPGCIAKPRQVCVYNTGLVPVTLESVALPGCSDEFNVEGLTALPQYLHPGEPICFTLDYLPIGAGKDECTLRITVNGAVDPIIDIPVQGSGHVVASQVDEFVQQRSDAVDILFVIDDSGSMCDEQEILLASFETFIERARIWNNEFQIGVITVDVEDQAIAGRLNRGDITVQPRYLLPSVDILNDFNDLAGIGCDGSSYIESGLHAALTALMPPLTTDTTVVCGGDGDCTSNPVICPEPANCDYACVDGTCAGFNKGFLRDDARLEVIVMSDEDDQSVLPVEDYVAMLQDLKAGLGEGMVHLNAIVGVEGVPFPGDEYSACTSSSGSSAVAGTRYVAAAEATGGVVGSICEDSFEEAMLAISEQAFSDGGRLEYFLSRPADSSTIVVAIDPLEGVFTDCDGGWEYRAEANAVVLDPSGACVPAPGHAVRVTYDVLCLNE